MYPKPKTVFVMEDPIYSKVTATRFFIHSSEPVIQDAVRSFPGLVYPQWSLDSCLADVNKNYDPDEVWLALFYTLDEIAKTIQADRDSSDLWGIDALDMSGI